MSKTVYLAGPITDATYQEARFGWRAQAVATLQAEGFSVLSPMRGKTFLERLQGKLGCDPDKYEMATAFEQSMASDPAIVTRDFNDIVRCDAMLVNLLGAKTISIGTVWELGVAYALRKPVVLVMEPDPVVLVMEPDNPHNHPMSRVTAGGRIVQDLDQAVDLLTFLIGEGV